MQQLPDDSVTTDSSIWESYVDLHLAVTDFLNEAFVVAGVALLVVGAVTTFFGGGSFAGGCFVAGLFLFGIGEDAEAGSAMAGLVAAGKGLLGGTRLVGFVLRLPLYAGCAVLAGTPYFLRLLAVTVLIDAFGVVLPAVQSVVLSTAASVGVFILTAIEVSSRDGHTFIPVLSAFLAVWVMFFSIERAQKAEGRR